MQRRRRMRAFRTVTVPAVAAVLIAVAAVTSGSVIPGGGPLPLGDAPFTDCYLYVRTNGTLTPNNQKFFVCEDGDPTCDQDGNAMARAPSAPPSARGSLAAARRRRWSSAASRHPGSTGCT